MHLSSTMGHHHLTLRNRSITMHNHNITPHIISRYPNTMHCEEIEVEDEAEEDLDEPEGQ
jgi:hypothetical protein